LLINIPESGIEGEGQRVRLEECVMKIENAG